EHDQECLLVELTLLPEPHRPCAVAAFVLAIVEHDRISTDDLCDQSRVQLGFSIRCPDCGSNVLLIHKGGAIRKFRMTCLLFNCLLFDCFLWVCQSVPPGCALTYPPVIFRHTPG